MPPRQLIRSDEIRAPDAPSDTVSNADMIAARAGGADGTISQDAYLNAITTQLRRLGGMSRWTSPLPSNVQALTQAVNASTPQALVLPCTPRVTPGVLVYIDSTGTADIADPGAYQTVLGMVVGMADSTHAKVQRYGAAPCPLASLAIGSPHFLGPGGLPVVPPLADNIIYVQRVGLALDSSTLLLQLNGISLRGYLGP